MVTSRHAGKVILHVVDHVSPETSGYSVRTHNLLRGLRAADFTVVAVASSSRASVVLEDEIDGVRYIRLPYRLEGAPQTIGVLWRRLVGFGRWLAAEAGGREVALLHAHSPVLNALPALWAARRRRIPLIYEMRGLWEDAVLDRDLSDRRDLRYRLSRALESAALRRADAVTTISEGLCAEIAGRGVPPERIVLAPNGVDSSEFRPEPADTALLARHGLTGRFVVGYVGYFHAYEGIEALLPGFARLRAAVPDAALLLVGGGPREASLRSQAERMGIAANVIFAGEVPHAEVRRYYSICDVVAYPRVSRRTTELITPLKPLEAMAMARAVVASDVGGLRELVRDGDTGMLFPPGDGRRLGEVLARMATDAPLRARLGANARRFVCDERSWERGVQSYAELYDRLLRPATRVRA